MVSESTISGIQQQLLEVALDLYRLCHRLHVMSETINVPFEIEDRYCESRGKFEPPTLELDLWLTIGAGSDEVKGLAEAFFGAAIETDVSVRRKWREKGLGRRNLERPVETDRKI